MLSEAHGAQKNVFGGVGMRMKTGPKGSHLTPPARLWACLALGTQKTLPSKACILGPAPAPQVLWVGSTHLLAAGPAARPEEGAHYLCALPLSGHFLLRELSPEVPFTSTVMESGGRRHEGEEL